VNNEGDMKAYKGHQNKGRKEHGGIEREEELKAYPRKKISTIEGGRGVKWKAYEGVASLSSGDQAEGLSGEK